VQRRGGKRRSRKNCTTPNRQILSSEKNKSGMLSIRNGVPRKGSNRTPSPKPAGADPDADASAAEARVECECVCVSAPITEVAATAAATADITNASAQVQNHG
jgi:hypothetical protein